MRCARVDPYIEAFVDGSLDPARASEIAAHVGSCAKCAARARAAGRINRALSAQGAIGAESRARAPHGFAHRVMDTVYREALVGVPRPSDAAARAAAARGAAARRASARAPARGYRRLGLSFVLTAGVLAASLFIPRIAYPSLMAASGAGAGFAGESSTSIRAALDGADAAMRGILGENGNGGNQR
jgi:anti-sigma factor RsiW